MTPEQKAAFIMARAAEAMITAMAMNAENQRMRVNGAAPYYSESDFLRVVVEHGIAHNAVVGFFQE